MTPEQISELIEYLKGLGDLAVSKRFEVAMRQVSVMLATQVVYCFVGIAFIMIAIALLKSANKMKKNIDEPKEAEWGEWSEEDIYTIKRAVGVAMGCLAIIGTADSMIKMASYLLNPEWYAIQLMLGLVK